MSQRVRLDANVILRFLRNDHPQHSPAAARLFQKASAGAVALCVSAVTMNEVFFALTSAYKLSHPEAAGKLLPFVQAGVIEFEHEACLVDALERVMAAKVDFGDAWLAATAAASKELVASFDRDLKKFGDIQFYEW